MDICGNSIHAGDAARQQIKYPIITLGSVSVRTCQRETGEGGFLSWNTPQGD